jgi:1,2-diacylglycerol 3-beta-galactosyltransferase
MNSPTASTAPPRVTILVANTGGGHYSVARGLAEAFEGLAHVTFLNLLDDHAPFPWNRCAATYGPLVNQYRWFWRVLYWYGTSRKRVTLSERLAYPLVRRQVGPPLFATCPDVVISAHPLEVAIPLRLLRSSGSRAPFVTIAADPVSPPLAWFCPDVDLCVVATEPARAVALEAGMDAAKVQVIGLPVRREFASVRGRSKPAARARLGLRADLPLIMLSGGGAGIGRLAELARAITMQLAASATPAQMAVITGHNATLRQSLEGEQWPIPVRILGFIKEMADWLAAVDLLITKAGPTTLAEAACVGVPAIITDFVPGQETGNVAWIERHGAGIFEPEPFRVARLVSEWLLPGNPSLAEMSVRAANIAQPHAAAQIVRATLSLLEPPVTKL